VKKYRRGKNGMSEEGVRRSGRRTLWGGRAGSGDKGGPSFCLDFVLFRNRDYVKKLEKMQFLCHR
jgi:hypothetical protein